MAVEVAEEDGEGGPRMDLSGAAVDAVNQMVVQWVEMVPGSFPAVHLQYEVGVHDDLCDGCFGVDGSDFVVADCECDAGAASGNEEIQLDSFRRDK